MTIHDKINARAFIKSFAGISEKELKARINKLKIRDSGDFENSIKVLGKDSGNTLSVEITYLWYGIFAQYGLGKGISMGDQGVARMVGGGRKQKKWMRGVGHIRNRLGEMYAQELADGYEKAIPGTTKINLKF